MEQLYKIIVEKVDGNTPLNKCEFFVTESSVVEIFSSGYCQQKITDAKTLNEYSIKDHVLTALNINPK